MLVLDIVIIYLACGAPFAVTSMLGRGDRLHLRHILTSLAAVVYWPVLAPSALRRIIGRSNLDVNSTASADLDSGEERLRSSFTEIWIQMFGAADVKRVRDEIERYAALSLELGRDVRPARESALSTISAHPDGEVANICLARLNRQKLELHRTNARVVLVEAVETLAAAGRADAIDIAERLAEAVGDDQAIEEIRASVRTTSVISATA